MHVSSSLHLSAMAGQHPGAGAESSKPAGPALQPEADEDEDLTEPPTDQASSEGIVCLKVWLNQKSPVLVIFPILKHLPRF